MFKSIKNFLLGSKLSMTNQTLWNEIKFTPLVEGDYNDATLISRIKKKTGWGTTKTREVIEEYRKFLYLFAISDTVSPSPDVDEVWHEHILFTQDYFERWPKVLGKTLHHYPEIKGKVNKFSDDYKRTTDSYSREFGSSDSFINYWPLWWMMSQDSSPTSQKTEDSSPNTPIINDDKSNSSTVDSTKDNSGGYNWGHNDHSSPSPTPAHDSSSCGSSSHSSHSDSSHSSHSSCSSSHSSCSSSSSSCSSSSCGGGSSCGGSS